MLFVIWDLKITQICTLYRAARSLHTKLINSFQMPYIALQSLMLIRDLKNMHKNRIDLDSRNRDRKLREAMVHTSHQ